MTSQAVTSRRQQILDIAADLFAARGFHGVSVAELGAACGISGPALYKHFPSKDAVLAEMLVSISERLLAEGTARVQASPDAQSAIEALVEWHIEFVLEHRALIVVQDRDWSSLPDEARERVRDLQRSYVDVWADAAQAGAPRAAHRPGPRDGPRRLRPAQLHPAQRADPGRPDARPAAWDGPRRTAPAGRHSLAVRVERMKLSTKLEKAFNAQITLEFQASLVYRQLAIELELMDLPGMAAWLRHQADEEIVHANKFIDHVADRDNHPVIGATTAPKVSVKSVLDAFKPRSRTRRRSRSRSATSTASPSPRVTSTPARSSTGSSRSRSRKRRP